MSDLFNKVSNYESSSWGYNTGNDIMTFGDIAVMAVGEYKCSGTGDNCQQSTKMLYTSALYGEVKCINDEATCIIDGEDTRQILYVSGTGVGKLTLRATTFKDGLTSSYYEGGGIYISSGTMDINPVSYTHLTLPTKA